MKFLLAILKDERGDFFDYWSPGIGFGKAFLEDEEGEEGTYDPYAAMRGKWNEWLTGKIGTSTAYKYNPAFNLDQPETEKETEATILGKLRNLPQKKEDIMGIYNRYGEARKASAQERQVDEMKKERERYNRLGLISSTPGLQAETELGRKQGLELGEIEAQTAAGGVAAEMEAEKLAEDIANMWATQGQLLGGKQRGYQQYGQQMSMRDMQRMLSEEMGYGGQAAGVLGGNAPQPYYNPSGMEQILGMGADMLPYIMMMMAASSRRYKKNIKLWAKPSNYYLN